MGNQCRFANAVRAGWEANPSPPLLRERPVFVGRNGWNWSGVRSSDPVGLHPGYWQPKQSFPDRVWEIQRGAGGPWRSIPDLERRPTAIQKDAALWTFTRLIPRPDAMARRDGTGQFESFPAEGLAAADD